MEGFVEADLRIQLVDKVLPARPHPRPLAINIHRNRRHQNDKLYHTNPNIHLLGFYLVLDMIYEHVIHYVTV